MNIHGVGDFTAMLLVAFVIGGMVGAIITLAVVMT